MKKMVLTTLILVLNFQIGFSINSYEIGDTLHNWAKSGLKIRAEKGFDSKVIETIPFGEQIIMLERKDEYYSHEYEFDIIDSYKVRGTEKDTIKFRGQWIKISFKDKIGYVFDSYLSKLGIPKETDLKEFLSSEIGIVKVVKALPKIGEGKEKIVYNNGAYLMNFIGGSTSNFKLVIPEFSFEEAFQLIYYLNTYVVKIEERKNDSINIHLECGFYQIRVVENVAIIIGEFGC
jgi:hypothetical protein